MRSVVTIAPSPVDYRSAPQNYAQVFQIYYRYIVNLVHQHGITDDNKEDVASDILTRFQERDSLAGYDPNLMFEYQGEMRPARFKNYITKFALKYVRGHLDRQRKLTRREIQICDMPVTGPSRSGAEAQSWADAYATPTESHEESVIDMVMEETLWLGLRGYLATVPRRSAFDRCDLVALFDVYRRQIREQGFSNIKTLSVEFGVSSTAMHGWVWWMRENIADYLGEPVPPRRPRTTKPKVEP